MISSFARPPNDSGHGPRPRRPAIGGRRVGLGDVGELDPALVRPAKELRDGHESPASSHQDRPRWPLFLRVPRDREVWIAVVHDAGFALRSPEQLAASAEITLLPWGRIEGVMKIGARTAPSERVSAWLRRAPYSGLGRARHPDRPGRPLQVRSGRSRAG